MHIPNRATGIGIAVLGAAAAYGGSLLPPVPASRSAPTSFRW